MDKFDKFDRKEIFCLFTAVAQLVSNTEESDCEAVQNQIVKPARVLADQLEECLRTLDGVKNE